MHTNTGRRNPRECSLKAEYLLTSYVSTRAMKPSGKAIAKDTIAASSPSLDSSVEMSRILASWPRYCRASSSRSRLSPSGGFRNFVNFWLENLTKIPPWLTGFLVGQHTRLQLLDAGERGNVRVGVGSLYRNVEKFARQHVGRAVKATWCNGWSGKLESFKSAVEKVKHGN